KRDRRGHDSRPMHRGSSAAAPSGRWTAIVDAIGTSQAVAGSGVTDSGDQIREPVTLRRLRAL
ncbi:MAG: hypothetical protein O9256_03025, partial [Rhizobiaceae bacterium]|nr:hypothetical protein [Rhizobiaceae bacterium]